MQSPEDHQLEQDKAAEAREVRRRRILENSNKRLGKITGREHNEGNPKISLFKNANLYKISVKCEWNLCRNRRNCYKWNLS